MKYLAFLFLLLSTLVSAASNSNNNNDVKLSKLKHSVSSDGIIVLNSDSHERYLQGKRNYSLIVLMTAMGSQFGCKPCHEFDPEFRLAASSYHYRKSRDDLLFFGVLDFADGNKIFQKMKINTAPFVYVYPANDGPFGTKNVEPFYYDLSNNGFKAEDFAKFVSSSIRGVESHEVKISRPINYQLIGMVLAAVGVGAVVLKLLQPIIVKIISNYKLWSTISVVFIVLMCSGHMWNHIRNPPYVAPGDKNRLEYVAPGFSNQYILETQIIASLYGLCTICLVIMTETIKRIKNDVARRLIPIIAFTIFLVSYSVILSTFRRKNGGYPFKLFFN